jgi:hypothetical protein
VPVLARIVESQGIPTVTVTMNPDLAAKFHLSRIVGVEFPYGHSFGTPHNDALMTAVAWKAVLALEDAAGTGYRVDVEPSEHPWPIAPEVAYKTWHPPQASPIVAEMLKRRG